MREQVNENIILDFDSQTIELYGDVDMGDAFRAIKEKYKDIIETVDDLESFIKWRVLITENCHAVFGEKISYEQRKN